MSSGFISAGSKEDFNEEGDGWAKAQQAIESDARKRQEEGRRAGDASLYDILQQNKTAKQEAFEESIRLKNQFRTLDDDEVDFLDSVLESTRAREEQVKKETAEQLEEFRKQCRALQNTHATVTGGADKASTDPQPPAAEESWAASSRKRRRGKEKDDVAAAKLRKKSSLVVDSLNTKPLIDVGQPAPVSVMENVQLSLDDKSEKEPSTEIPNIEDPNIFEGLPPTSNSPPHGLGLGAYDSEDE